MGAVKTYDPKQFKIIFGGVAISGFADGPFISVAPAGDRFTKVSGADGEKARSKSNDYSHEVTLTLLQTSASNDYLSTIHNIDKLSNLGKLPLQIVDLNGTTILSWSQAWIRAVPTVENAKEIGERVWVFDTSDADIENYGGNLL